jgi:hypothetical protein
MPILRHGGRRGHVPSTFPGRIDEDPQAPRSRGAASGHKEAGVVVKTVAGAGAAGLDAVVAVTRFVGHGAATVVDTGTEILVAPIRGGAAVLRKASEPPAAPAPFTPAEPAADAEPAGPAEAANGATADGPAAGGGA